MQTAIIPSLDETMSPIMVSTPRGNRAATPQETRAINALAAVLDDQPPPASKSFDDLFEWSGQDYIEWGAVQPKPVVRRAAASHRIRKPIIKQAVKEVEPHVIPTPSIPEGPAPAFAAPPYERVEKSALVAEVPEEEEITLKLIELGTATITTRDEMMAVASEVAARVEQPKTDDIMKVADMMPFGAATLRLFCC